MKFDKERAEKVFSERVTGERCIGRTTAAIYVAIKHCIANPGTDGLYIAAVTAQAGYAFQAAHEILRQEFPQAEILTGASKDKIIFMLPKCIPSSLTIFSGSLETADRFRCDFVADDLGEWKDIHRRSKRYFNPDVQAIYDGKPPPGTR